ncbi:MAG: MOSC domain-containing protein [Gemmataceae bacterium]
MAHLVSITVKPANAPRDAARFTRISTPRAELVADHGIAGDAKASPGRQLNVMLAETVALLAAEGFRAGPGELGEQLVIAGAPDAAPGQRLRLGPAAVIELEEPREPCGRFARVQGRARETAIGRIGFMARVVVSGAITVGCEVSSVPAQS